MAPSLEFDSQSRPKNSAWFPSEALARGYAKEWASQHVRSCTVYKCHPIVSIEGNAASTRGHASRKNAMSPSSGRGTCVFAVMVPAQGDGGGEWVDPILWLGFMTEAQAEEQARGWAPDHIGVATVYRCDPVVDVQLKQKATFDEDFYPASSEDR